MISRFLNIIVFSLFSITYSLSQTRYNLGYGIGYYGGVEKPMDGLFQPLGLGLDFRFKYLRTCFNFIKNINDKYKNKNWLGVEFTIVFIGGIEIGYYKLLS